MQIKGLPEGLGDAVLRETVQPLWAQVLPLLAPLPQPPQEVIYDDRFLEIRQELEKSTLLDLERIEAAGRYLCVSVAKDVRVAVYLTYVWFCREAFPGLIRGLLLLYGMQTVYAAEFQPRRLAVIRTMLRWLAGDKMENALLLCSSRLLADEWQVIQALCALIQDNFSSQFGCGFEELNALLALLPAEGLAGAAGAAAPAVTEAAVKQPEPAAAAEITRPQALRTSGDLLETMRAVGDFIAARENNVWAAQRLLRVFRWDLVRQLPLNEQGVTRVVAPRPGLLGQLEGLYERQDWPALWQQCQGAFMEMSNHFCLDLQYLGWCAMQHMGAEGLCWADMLSSDLAMLLGRLPGLELLSFTDGRPFAGLQTRQWIEVHACLRQQDPQQPSAREDDALGGLAEVEEQAFAILREHDLQEALRWLQTIVFDEDALSVARRQFLTARLAIEAGEVDFARALLERLNGMLSAEPLFSWDKRWNFQVKFALLQLWRRQKPAAGLPVLQAQMRQLVDELTVLDPCQAHQLLYK